MDHPDRNGLTSGKALVLTLGAIALRADADRLEHAGGFDDIPRLQMVAGGSLRLELELCTGERDVAKLGAKHDAPVFDPAVSDPVLFDPALFELLVFGLLTRRAPRNGPPMGAFV